MGTAIGNATAFNGYALRHGHRSVWELPFADLLDFVTYWLFENLDEKERFRLESELLMPLAGADPENIPADHAVWGAEAELASWPMWTG